MNKNKIILGTVQMGLDYGINNFQGKIDKNECFKILKYCYDSGIKILDTADSYGDSKGIIGEFISKSNLKLEINNKFHQFIDSYSFENQIIEDLKLFSINSFETYMFHNLSYFNNQTVLNSLINFKYLGLIKKIGVSIYTNEEFLDAINSPFVDVIQFPFNLFDNFNLRGELILLAKKNSKELHARSVFLQGLFCKKNIKNDDRFKDLLKDLFIINQLADKYNLPIQAMALQYVLSINEIDKVVLGVDSLTQLQENYNYSLQSIDQLLINEINSIRVENVSLLNPTNWKKKI